jgi:hypothetical protein
MKSNRRTISRATLGAARRSSSMSGAVFYPGEAPQVSPAAIKTWATSGSAGADPP